MNVKIAIPGRVMKILFLLSFFVVIPWNGNTQDAKQAQVTLKGSMTIVQAFHALEAQIPFTIAYKQEGFNTSETKVFSLIKVSLHSAMTAILKNTGYTYKIAGNHIILVPEQAAKRPSVVLSDTLTIGKPLEKPVPGDIGKAPGSPYDTPPVIGLKTNILYWATTTMNLAAELRVGSKWSLDVPVNYNPWEYAGNKNLNSY